MPAEYALPEVLNTQGATEILSALKSHRGADLTIDASQVRHLGAQAAQVLLAAAKSWADDGHAFRFASPSPDMLRCVELLGAEDALKGAMQ